MCITELLLSLFFATLILFFVEDSTVVSIIDAIEKLVYFKSFQIGAFLNLIFTKCTNFYNQLELIAFFKQIEPIVNVLTGLAAILGITIPLVALFRSKRSAIRITSIKVIENQSSGKCSFALTFANCKNYPVSLYETNIYNKKFFLVTESTSNSVTFSGPGFSDSHRVFTKKLTIIIPASGNLPITLSDCEIFQHGELFAHLHTSDGFQTIKCKKIEFIKTGEAEIYNNTYDISGFFKAKLIYYGLRFPFRYTKSLAKKYAEKYSYGNNTG